MRRIVSVTNGPDTGIMGRVLAITEIPETKPYLMLKRGRFVSRNKHRVWVDSDVKPFYVLEMWTEDYHVKRRKNSHTDAKADKGSGKGGKE